MCSYADELLDHEDDPATGRCSRRMLVLMYNVTLGPYLRSTGTAGINAVSFIVSHHVVTFLSNAPDRL